MSVTPAHFVFVAIDHWGHVRAMHALALNLATLFPSLYVTLLVPRTCYADLKHELEMFDPPEDVAKRHRVIAIGGSAEGKTRHNWEYVFSGVIHDLPSALDNLRPDRDSTHGFSRKPTLVVADFILVGVVKTIIAAAEDSSNDFSICPILAYSPTPAAWGIRRLTATSGKRYKSLRANPANKDVSDDVLIEKAYAYTDGSVITVEGNQPVYDYELQPQLGNVPFDAKFTFTVREASQQLKDCAGLVLVTSPELEPGVDAKLAELINGVCLQVGPQFPASWWDRSITPIGLARKEKDLEVMSFLDDAEKRFGKKSVMYISFGSFYSPSGRPDLFENLVNSLLTAEPPLPFVFATVTTGKAIPESLRKRVAESGLGMFTPFAPQQGVLRHPATGWFLTHAGSNSVSEGCLNSVPLIAWPCMTDQPIAASQLVLNLKMAFELIQVRTGPSVGKATYRGIQHLGGSRETMTAEMTDMWARIRGPEGDEVRERVEAI